MFYNKPECIKYSDKVFLFKNVIDTATVQKINSLANSLNSADYEYESQAVDWYKDKTGPNMAELFPVWETMSDLIYPEYMMHPMLSLLRMLPGKGEMFVHVDSPGRDMEEELTQLDMWQTCCIIDYGIISYFGDFTGGEVFYPNLKPDGTPFDGQPSQDCLTVPVEPGDVVIHGALSPYDHGVREVKSGTRYAFTNFMVQAVENPGTFNNYKTKEYYDQTADKSVDALTDNWCRPLEWNPRFPEYEDLNK